MSPGLLVAGSLTVDNVRTADGVLLPPRPGGNVIFAALGARLWSNAIGLVSRAGADYPAGALDRLAARGLDLAGITRVDAPHGMNVAFSYAPDGSRIRIFPARHHAIHPTGRARALHRLHRRRTGSPLRDLASLLTRCVGHPAHLARSHRRRTPGRDAGDQPSLARPRFASGPRATRLTLVRRTRHARAAARDDCWPTWRC